MDKYELINIMKDQIECIFESIENNILSLQITVEELTNLLEYQKLLEYNFDEIHEQLKQNDKQG